MSVSEHRDDDSERLGTADQATAAGSARQREQATAKFIQICASQDDLFALDQAGNIYQYNFNAKTWVKLGESRSYEGCV